MTLLLPALLAAADTWLREQRAELAQTRRSIPWALERALLPLAALLLAYLLGLVGLVPGPDFPYDPGRFPAGAEAPIAFGADRRRLRPGGAARPADADAARLRAAHARRRGRAAWPRGAVLGIWFLNPYLALLLAPAAHVWLLPARAPGPPRAAASSF